MSYSKRNRGLGGALRMRDKQAYYGLLVVIIAVLGFGAYKLIRLAASELRAMPNDDPDMEMNVDELRIHKAEEQDAILMGDSLSQQYNLDSIKRKVQIDTRPVYRPPRKNDEWYITKKEWKSIFKNYRIWRRMKQKEEEDN
ncbi:MAG: hypothetical protein IJQ18_05995 [Paludibacteraceae bacterium]|nr:hypothetical protein [Paludibacteraceae bacterium]